MRDQKRVRQVASRHDMTGDMHSMGSPVFIVREEKGKQELVLLSFL